MIGAEKVMTMTSTYDHRVIQGAESGRFLARIEDYLQGGTASTRMSSRRSASRSARSRRARAGGGRRGRRGSTSPASPRHPGRRGDAAGGPGGEHLVSRVPQPRPPRGAPRPAGLRARGRPGPRPGGARADAGDPGETPGEDLPDVRARGDARRRAAAPAGDLLRDDRVRDRAHRLPPPARYGCASTSSREPSATS